MKRMPMAKQRETARAALRAQLRERGGDGTLRDLQAHLAEDSLTVMIFADWSTDQPAWTYIQLGRPCSQANFDADAFLAWFLDPRTARRH
jgi:hypothetical protein